MTLNPKLLGIFIDLYGSYEAMTIPKALLISVVGFSTVLIILAIIALFIKAIAGVFSLAEKRKKAMPDQTASVETPAPNGAPLPETQSQGELALIEVDEPTAAVVMALVSHQSGIPLNRLKFKSIKLLGDD